MTQQEELKVLFPEASVTLSTGETIAIKPFTFGQLPKAMSMATGMSALVHRAIEPAGVNPETGEELPPKNLQQSVMIALSEGGEELLQLIAFGIGKPRTWFDTLGADDGVLITTEFLAVNFDFFTKKVLPQFQAGMAKFKGSQTPSLNSSAGASPTAT